MQCETQQKHINDSSKLTKKFEQSNHESIVKEKMCAKKK